MKKLIAAYVFVIVVYVSLTVCLVLTMAHFIRKFW